MTTPLAASWGRLSAVMTPSYLSKDGRTRAWSMDPNGEQRGESWMPNTSAWPNDASVCSLSQILETGPIQRKYFLSGRMCAAILRRAERRGKKLPAQLRRALAAVAGSGQISNATGEQSPCASTPKAGGGRIDAESETFVTHSLRVEGHDASEDGTGRGVPIIAWDEKINAHVDISGPVIRGGDGGRHAGVMAFAQNSRDEVRLLNGDGSIAGALGAESGMKQTTYVAVGKAKEGVMTLAIRGRGDSTDLEARADGTANALLTPNGGRGGIGVGAVAYSIQAGAARENPESGPDGVGVQADVAYTLEARQEVQAVAHMAVRRLTPREAERLQGFPDNYTNIPGAADGPRYKTLGNSFAVPVVAWIGRRIKEAYAND